jgi:hypothetical protein
MRTRLPIQRISMTQDQLPAMFKDLYRRVQTIEGRYPGGPKVGTTVAVQSVADLPPPRVGMRAYVIDTGTLWQVPGTVPMSSLPPVGVWTDTLTLPPP